MASDTLDIPATSNRLHAIAGKGYLGSKNLTRGLQLIGALPNIRMWERFLDVSLLVLSAAFLTSGVIFFFAFNWAAMHRFIKFGLVAFIILALVSFVSYKKLEGLPAKLSLAGASFLVGALLTVISQGYQTGSADPYRLFLGWATLIVGWAIVSRFSPIWFLLILLVNVGVSLYWGQALAGADISMYLLLFGINTGAAAAWEMSHRSGIEWLRSRWTVRLFVLAASISIITPTIQYIFESSYRFQEPNLSIAPLVFILFSGGVLYYYTQRLTDLFILTVGSFGIIAVLTSLLISNMTFDSAGELLFVGLAIIGQAGLAVSWLRRVDMAGRETDAKQ